MVPVGFSANLLFCCLCSTGLCAATERQGFGILKQLIVGLLMLHRFVRSHIETVIWDSQTTYCWAVYAPQVSAEPDRDRDMIWDSQGQGLGIWDFQATYCSAVCAPQVFALPHRDRILGISNNFLLGCLCSTGLCAAT